MTVKELTEVLNGYPSDMIVIVDGTKVKGVEVSQDDSGKHLLEIY